MFAPPSGFTEDLFWGRLTGEYLKASMFPDQRPLGRLTERTIAQAWDLRACQWQDNSLICPSVGLPGLTTPSSPHPRNMTMKGRALPTWPNSYACYHQVGKTVEGMIIKETRLDLDKIKKFHFLYRSKGKCELSFANLQHMFKSHYLFKLQISWWTYGFSDLLK